ncbi:beta-hexosaminidase [Elysia marginata]|uniref:beta-N-acetylhexosaminidase n=1 Tax=Elysia marginata TaxID=1093978 RepID=A0AAV4H2Z5_9GAST|nr:beta-hexosaminidase [Elysia marginata]
MQSLLSKKSIGELVEITLTNSRNSGVNLANDAWQLHLYCIFMIEPDMMGPFGHTTIVLPGQYVSITHVHGSHFYISPTREFPTIPPGGTRKIKFKVRYWSVTRTDTMPHWYLTYGSFQPRIITSTAAESLRFVADRTRVEQLKRYDFDRYLPFTPQDRFERYDLGEDNPSSAEIRLVPKPLRVSVDGDRTVSLDQTWIISCPSTLASEAAYLSDSLRLSLTIIYDGSPQSTASAGANVIRLETGEVTFTTDETNHVIADSGDAYSLTVNANGQRIVIVGQAASGVFYGVVSLVSLMDGTNVVPAYTIYDGPRFEYRGFMLDIARNFHTEQELKTLIETMAMYKLNKLHLHLTDDEGWRLEIRTLPELTQIGATQCHDMSETTCLLTEIGSVPEASSKFLTAAQYRSLLNLANQRHVTIIPEIDMPGHARAAIKSMEARMSRYPNGQDMRLTEPGDPSKYLSVQMFNDNAINPCLQSVWNFVEVVMDELIRLHSDAGHPLETFHFGGDEVTRGAWVKSTACQKLKDDGQLPEDSVKAYLFQVGLMPCSKLFLKAERNKLLHELQSMVKCKRNNELDKAAEDIDNLPDHARMFKAVKSLNRKKSETPYIFDADGKFITNIDEIQTVIGKHIKDKFRDDQTMI